jgi:hypothetical protein
VAGEGGRHDPGPSPLNTDPQAAIATVEPGTGAVRVLASGRDFNKTQTDSRLNSIHQEAVVQAVHAGGRVPGRVPPGQVYRRTPR